MNIVRLQEHEHPARPDHDLRGRSVLDSSDHQLGYVANLFVDEDERHLRFIDVVPRTGWGGRESVTTTWSPSRPWSCLMRRAGGTSTARWSCRWTGTP